MCFEISISSAIEPVRETRIVSPMPAWRRVLMPIVFLTVPGRRGPAEVTPM